MSGNEQREFDPACGHSSKIMHNYAEHHYGNASVEKVLGDRIYLKCRGSVRGISLLNVGHQFPPV
jgi:hypothetical protein